jgi:hypothetical protein
VKTIAKKVSVFVLLLFLAFCFLPSLPFINAVDGTISYNPTSNTITVSGFSKDGPANFEDLYNADKAGTLILTSRIVQTADNNPVNLIVNLRPSDQGTLGGSAENLYLNVTDFSGFTDATIMLIGTDSSGIYQNELIPVTDVGVYYPVGTYATLSQSQVVSVSGDGALSYKLASKSYGASCAQWTHRIHFPLILSYNTGSYLKRTQTNKLQ